MIHFGKETPQRINYVKYKNIFYIAQYSLSGVITNGGAKPNIIPEETELLYYVRTPTKGELTVLKEKCVNCFKAAATSTGCTVRKGFPGNM